MQYLAVSILFSHLHSIVYGLCVQGIHNSDIHTDFENSTQYTKVWISGIFSTGLLYCLSVLFYISCTLYFNYSSGIMLHSHFSFYLSEILVFKEWFCLFWFKVGATIITYIILLSNVLYLITERGKTWIHWFYLHDIYSI